MGHHQVASHGARALVERFQQTVAHLTHYPDIPCVAVDEGCMALGTLQDVVPRSAVQVRNAL
jgi:hypothetical protein